MPEWIRPDGCEGGACVEYRTVNGRVFVRSCEDDDMIQFSVAEWDTFVASLVREERHARRLNEAALGGEIAKLRENLITECAQTESLAANLDKLGKDYTRVMTERDNLAAENARLRQERDKAQGVAKQLSGQIAEVEEDRDKLRIRLAGVLNQRDHAYNELATETKAHRAAIAEAAVLRHRDRRTQAVVAAAKAWREGHRDGASQATKPIHDRFLSLIAAVDALESDPLTGLSATEPVQQPQPVAQSTDGPEPQGEAQYGYQNSSGAIDTAALAEKAIKVRWGEPRVWNAGDPEPEGVEKVTDSEGDVWVRTGNVWIYTDENDTRVPSYWHPLTAGCAPLTEVLPEPTPKPDTWPNDGWPLATHASPAKVTMDSPAPQVAAGDGDGARPNTGAVTAKTFSEALKGDLQRFSAALFGPRPNYPDGAVPEAGRAGEAQTGAHCACGARLGKCPVCDEDRCPSCDAGESCEPIAQAQDRTEVGLDAAIEAFAAARAEHYGSVISLPSGKCAWRCNCGSGRDVSAAVEWEEAAREMHNHEDRTWLAAASPLIERAALNAAAEAVLYEATGADLRNEETIAAWLRDRATRTEAP